MSQAILRARLEASPDFPGRHLLKGNVPMPALPPEQLELLRVLDPRTGKLLPTQLEVTETNAAGRVTVAEVLALVDVPVNGATAFDLVELDLPPEGDEVTGADVLPQLLEGPTLADVRLASDDHRGARYGSPLLAPWGALVPQGQPEPARDLAWWRQGAVVRTRRVAGELKLSATDTNPDRYLGFVAWLTEVAGEKDVLLVELVVHNACAVAPIAGDIYFRDLALELPEGWEVVHLWPEPWSGGAPEPSGARSRLRRHLLVKRPSDGRNHLMEQKRRREFRFAIYRQGNLARARALLEESGLCVPVPGPSGNGAPLWSWESLAAYFPQGVRLPLSALRAGVSRAALATRPFDGGKAKVWAALESGAALPSWANQGAAGPYHPYSISYGGGTGGEGILQVDGVELAVTGDRSILHALRAVHRMNTDRSPIGLYDVDGHVVDHEDWPKGWAVNQPGGFAKGAEGAWAFSKASQWRRDQVYAAGTAPLYESYLRSFSPYDFQHLVRRTSQSLALVYLNRDPIAWAELELVGEWARMWAHEGQGSLAWAYQQTRDWPGKGGAGGRDDGWAWLAVLARHQLVPQGGDYAARRARLAGWIAIAVEVVRKGQMPSGSWMALSSGKPFDQLDGSSAVGQAIEHGIFAAAVAALRRAAGAAGANLAEVLTFAALGQWRFHWSPGQAAPWRIRAVRPVDKSLPAYAERSDVPPGAHLPAGDIDGTQIGSLLAAGLEAALSFGDAPEVAELVAAADALTGYTGDPVAALAAKPLVNLEDRAALRVALEIAVAAGGAGGGQTDPGRGDPGSGRGETDPGRGGSHGGSGETEPPPRRRHPPLDPAHRDQVLERVAAALERARVALERRAAAAGAPPLDEERWLDVVERRLAELVLDGTGR